MILYKVRYKRKGIFFWNFFWRELGEVKGDAILEVARVRIFILKDDTCINIPIDGTIFEFSKEREFSRAKEIQDKINSAVPEHHNY